MGKKAGKQAAQGSRERISELTEMIAQAFQLVQRENGVSLHEADVLDSYGTESERASARRKDLDKSWAEVPTSDIERYHSILSFLDPKGFRYYIPAYMTWSLRNYRQSRSMTIDSTIYSLALHDEADLRKWQLERFSLLTKEQGRAVFAFLQYMAYESEGRADERIARDAIRKYWKQFE